MKIKLAVLTVACALLSISTVAAQDTAEREPIADIATPAEQTAPSPLMTFGSGFNVVGPGGSATSLTGGPGSLIDNSGGGETPPTTSGVGGSAI